MSRFAKMVSQNAIGGRLFGIEEKAGTPDSGIKGFCRFMIQVSLYITGTSIRSVFSRTYNHQAEQAHFDGLVQLGDYLERQGVDEGFLLVYDFRSKKEWGDNPQVVLEELSAGRKDVFAVWV